MMFKSNKIQFDEDFNFYSFMLTAEFSLFFIFKALNNKKKTNKKRKLIDSHSRHNNR